LIAAKQEKPMCITPRSLLVFLLVLPLGEPLFAQSALYWTDQTTNRIQRLTLDGSPVETVAEGPLASPGKMIVDFRTGYLYWTNVGRKKIMRMSSSGLRLEEVQAGHLVSLDEETRQMYVLRDTALYRTDLDGGGGEKLTDLPDLFGSGSRVPPVAVDVRSEKVYWFCLIQAVGSAAYAGIRRANLDGSEQEIFKERPGALVGLEVDTLSNRLYLYDAWGPHNFSYVDLESGGNRQYEDHHEWVTGFAVHPHERKLYWIESKFGAVYRSDLDGSHVEHISEVVGQPTAIAIDPLRYRLYWSTPFEIWRADANIYDASVSGVTAVLSSNLAELAGIDVDGASGHVYWTNGKAILRMDDTGKDEVVVVEGLGERIEDVALDPSRGSLYWSTTWSFSEGSGGVLRSRLDGSEIQSPVILPKSTGGPIAVDVDNDRLFWADDTGIYAAHSDGSNRTLIQPQASGGRFSAFHDLAIDQDRGRMYWARESSVGWTSLDGSTMRFITRNTNVVPAVAVDPNSGYLFWSASTFDQMIGAWVGVIWRKAPEDNAEAELVASGLGRVSSVTVVSPGTSTTALNEELPSGFVLHQNYPNPFNPATIIAYELPDAVDVKLSLLDITGREVRVLDSGLKQAGSHRLTLRAGDLPSGVYLYRLRAGDHTDTRSLIVAK
jgi:sugar lactone lactonase YvrE